MQTIIDNLNIAMKQKGWNTNRLARESGVPQPTISRFLNREHEEIKTKFIRQIAVALGTSERALRGFGKVPELPVWYGKYSNLSEEKKYLVEQIINNISDEPARNERVHWL